MNYFEIKDDSWEEIVKYYYVNKNKMEKCTFFNKIKETENIVLDFNKIKMNNINITEINDLKIF